MGSTLEGRGWQLAGLSIRDGGLGLRHPTKHAYAAFIASLQDSLELIKLIDPLFDPGDTGGHSGLTAALDGFNAMVGSTEGLSAGGTTHKQKQLSSMVDRSNRTRLLVEHSTDRFFCAHVALVSAEGAGAWLTALPEDEQRSWEGDEELFRIALKRRCRAPVQQMDTFCPSCGGIMDSFGDHGLVCPCRGDRTLRHNALRDLTFMEAACARCSPEREKSGLLPGRPLEDGATAGDADSPDDRSRRPADVYLPKGSGGSTRQPAALDWAVTSGLRSDRVEHAAAGTADILEEYADFKRDY